MAKTLADIRAEYPQYDRFDDKTLADALYTKHYSHADRREFDARIGLNPYDNPIELAGKVAQNIGPSITGSLQSATVGAAEAVQDVVRGVPMGGGPAMAPITAITQGAGAAARLLGLGDETEAAAEAVIQDQARKRAVNDLKQALNAPDVAADSPEELAYNVLFAATDVAAPMAASILLRNPGPMVAYGTLRSGAEGYEKARDAGLSTTEARAASGLYAASEAVTEYLGTKLLLEGGKTLVGSVLRGGLSEGLTEGATEALTALIDAGVIGEEMTLEDAMKRVQMGATVGGILGGPLGGVGYLTKPKEQQETAEAISEEVLGAQPDEEVVTVEDSLQLPAPDTMLALPAPDAPLVITRRQPAAPVQTEVAATPEQEIDYQAQVALRKTRQAETEALLQTARETVSPLGSFTRNDIETAFSGRQERRGVDGELFVRYSDDAPWVRASNFGDGGASQGKKGVSPVQRVMTWRAQTGRNMDAPITVEEMARAKVPQSVIDTVITSRRPMTKGQVVVPNDIRAVAESKNIIADDDAFGELAFRTTGQRNIDRMSQAQLSVLKSTIESLPSHESRVTLPIADAPAFDEGQYNKSLDAIRNQGRFTLAAIKDASGARDDGIARSIRDAMVRRGQLVQRGKNDFRLYDVLGAERQAVPDDLPPGAFSEYVVKKTPVNRIQIKVGGKSIGTFGSGTEARNKIRELRAKEAEKGGTPAQIELGQAEESAYAVMENRYDEAGNLLGQVAVDTSRDETAARKLAEQRNNPDTGARYTQTLVTPEGVAQPTPKAKPKRGPPPAALAGRTDEVISKLNAAARERALPLLGTTVKVVDVAKAPNGEAVRGMFLNNVISITAGNLEPGLSTDQVVDRLAQVMDHELIHALKRAGVLSPETPAWKTLSKYVSKTKRPDSGETYLQFTKRVYADVPGYTTEADMVEEAIAEAFRVWAANRRNVVGQPATAFRQLVEWFKRLFNALPDDIFSAIESGAMVRDALTPPGAGQPRAVAAEEMAAARKAAVAAQAAKDENAARIAKRAFLRARDQAREDRLGRSGPKTVIGTTPSRAFSASAPVPPDVIDTIVDKYRASAGISTKGLATLLPEDVDYLARIADAQQRAVHDPADNAVAKAYRALTTETKSMFDSLGITEIARWTEDGQPYASVDEMFADMAAGRLKLRLSADMFGEGADNPGHPMYKASGVKAADGTPLVLNDLFRVVHDVYGRAPIGLKRDSGRDDYNAYHEHARLVSDDARKALATETLAQGAWHHYGPHLRRNDGTVPRERDVDYLAPERKEFAEQKAFLLDEKLLAADPGWALAEKADAAVTDAGVEPTENARFMVAWHGTPHTVDRFSSEKIGTGEGAQAFGHGLYFAGKKEVADFYRDTLTASAEVPAAVKAILRKVDNLGFGGARAAAKAISNNKDWQTRWEVPELSASEVRNLEDYAAKMRGNVYKVDIPEDNELLDWDAPLSKQPPKVRAILEDLGWTQDELGAEDPTGSQIYQRSKPFMGAESAASEALRAAGIPGHRYLDAGSRVTGDGSRNYVIYDDSRIQIIDTNPKFSLYDEHLPGGRLYGNAKRSPGGAVSAPDTAPPAFSKQRDGNAFFGGDMASEQLRMAQVGERGTTMLYLSPDEFLALAGNPVNPEQTVYDGLVAEGYKFNTLPSLVIDGYAGKVRAVEADGGYAVVALAGRAERIPVAIYPKRGENLGLVTAIDAPGVSVPWPADGRAENYLDTREGDTGPTYDLNSAYGTRVPRHDLGEDPKLMRATVEPFDLYRVGTGAVSGRAPGAPPMAGPTAGLGANNIIRQRAEGVIGRTLHKIARSKKTIVPTKLLQGMIGESLFDFRVKNFDDRMLSVKEMLENVEDMGGTINADANPYVMEQQASGVTVAEIESREQSLYDPLYRSIVEAQQGNNALTYAEIEDGLYALHAPERNAFLRARGSKIPDPSGMSDAEADAILNKIADKGAYDKFEAVANAVQDVVRNTNETRFKAGLISKETYESSNFTWYIPLRGKREIDLDADEVYQPDVKARSGKGYSVSGKEDRSMAGRVSRGENLLANAIIQNTETVIRAEKNRVALSFARLVADNPNTGYGRVVDKVPTKPVVDSSTGMIREAVDPSYRTKSDQYVIARYNGKDVIVESSDPRVTRALNAPYVTPSSGIVQVMGTFNRYQAFMNTAASPDFLINNLLRGLQEAGVMSAQYDIKGLSVKILATSRVAMNGIHAVLREDMGDRVMLEKIFGAGKDVDKWSNAYKELRAVGGTVEFLGIHSLEDTARQMQKMAAKSGLNPTMRQAHEWAKNGLGFVEDINRVAENGIRLSAYVAAKEAGMTTDQAAYLAKNVMANFNKGGENKALLNSWYLFYNAAAAGNSVILRGLKSKRVQKLVGGFVAAAFMQDFLNRAFLSGDDDENGVKDYDEIPPYVLETSWVVMDPFGIGKALGNDKAYFAMKMPYGLNAFANLGRNLSRILHGSPGGSAGADVESIIMTGIDAYNPMGGSNSFLNFIAPTLADPWIDMASNTDFAGNAIVPESKGFGLEVPDSQKYWANTGPVPVWVADRVNAITGGNAVREGAIDVSPETYQFWFDYLTGAAGTTVKRLGNIGVNMANGDFDNIKLGDVPITRNFMGDAGTRQNTEMFYTIREDLQKTEAEIEMAQSTGNTALLDDIFQNRQADLAMIDVFNKQEKALAALRKQIRDIRANEHIDAGDKRDMVKSLQEEQANMMSWLNRLYFETKGFPNVPYQFSLM